MTIKELYEWAEEHDALDAVIIPEPIIDESVLPIAHDPYKTTIEGKDAVALVFD